MIDLRELTEALEEATGPDRELDARILIAVNGWREADVITLHDGDKPSSAFSGNTIVFRKTITPHATTHIPLHYTASIDAAMTLVPEGWFVSALAQWKSGAPTRTWATTLTREGDYYTAHTSNRPTAAIALCIATLRARAALEGTK